MLFPVFKARDSLIPCMIQPLVFRRQCKYGFLFLKLVIINLFSLILPLKFEMAMCFPAIRSHLFHVLPFCMFICTHMYVQIRVCQHTKLCACKTKFLYVYVSVKIVHIYKRIFILKAELFLLLKTKQTHTLPHKHMP